MSNCRAQFEGTATFDAEGNVAISNLSITKIKKERHYLEKVFGRNSDKFLKMPSGINRIYGSVR